MVRIGISVEGPTEERFVKMVLAPYLLEKGINMVPISLGGNVSVDRVTSELKKIANSFQYVTTLYDFYGFKKKVADDTKTKLEARIKDQVAGGVKSKLIAYVQMYEFEALLFSCPDAMEHIINESGIKDWCQGVLKEFDDNPEQINNSAQTAPSKRLEQYTDYRKTIHGPNIAQEIGIEKIRKKCSGFDQWLTKLEALVE